MDLMSCTKQNFFVLVHSGATSLCHKLVVTEKSDKNKCSNTCEHMNMWERQHKGGLHVRLPRRPAACALTKETPSYNMIENNFCTSDQWTALSHHDQQTVRNISGLDYLLLHLEHIEDKVTRVMGLGPEQAGDTCRLALLYEY